MGLGRIGRVGIGIGIVVTAGRSFGIAGFDYLYMEEPLIRMGFVVIIYLGCIQ